MYRELLFLGARTALLGFAIVMFAVVDREIGWFILALYAIEVYQFQMRMQKPK